MTGQEHEALNAAWNRCVEGRGRPFLSGDAGFWFHAGFEACYEAALAVGEEPQGDRVEQVAMFIYGEVGPTSVCIWESVDEPSKVQWRAVAKRLLRTLAAREDTERPDDRLEKLRETIVELWHKTPPRSTPELHECLGMTWDEYQAWVVRDTEQEPER